MKKLAIKSVNNYGDPLYTENFNENSEIYDYPKDNDIWAIFCPSEKIKSYYPNCKVRTYNNKEYLLSSKAKEFIPDDLKVYGSCAIIDFYHQSKKYFIIGACLFPLSVHGGGGRPLQTTTILKLDPPRSISTYACSAAVCITPHRRTCESITSHLSAPGNRSEPNAS